MERICKKNSPIKPILAELQIGDVVKFPVSRASTIRTSCSCLKLEKGKVFECTTERKIKKISVMRVK